MNPHIKQRGLLNFRSLIILGPILFFILILGYFFYGLQPSEATSVRAGNVFKISRGEGFRSIGAKLSQESLIKSITVFKIYSILTGRAQKFQPGVYEISPSLSVPQIVEILTSAGKNEITVVIPEGLTIKDLAEVLAAKNIVPSEVLLTYPFKNLSGDYSFLGETETLEGFLFPDTYRFEIDTPAETVLRRFLDNFKLKAWPLLSQGKNWYDSLILASLLEREVPNFDDRQIVAGILLKRLSKGIPLQVDATLSYAKCTGKLIDCSGILVTRSDLKNPSLYNTYQYLGLTPTPISNPGQSAIRAALSPRTSPYLYYLSAAKTGETIFSKTLEEHNQKRAKYL